MLPRGLTLSKWGRRVGFRVGRFSPEFLNGMVQKNINHFSYQNYTSKPSTIHENGYTKFRDQKVAGETPIDAEVVEDLPRFLEKNLSVGSNKLVLKTLISFYETKDKTWIPSRKFLTYIEPPLIKVFSSECSKSMIYQAAIMISVMDKTHNVKTMPKKLLDAIEHFIVNCQDIHTVSFHQFLKGLHGMKFKFHHFKLATQAKFLELFNCQDRFDNLHEQEGLFAGMNRIVQMEFPRECVDLKVLEKSVLKMNYSLNCISFISIFEHLAKLEFRWDVLPPHFHGLIVKCLNHSKIRKTQITQIVHALSIMSFDCPQTADLMKMHKEVLNQKTVDNDGYEAVQVLAYFEFLDSFYEGQNLLHFYRNHRMPKQSPDNYLELGPDFPYQVGDFLKDSLVLKTNNKMDIKIVPYFVGLESTVYPVDCAVFVDNKLSIFIIFDEETCYNNNTSELKRSEQFKDFLYARKFPEVGLYRMKRSEIHEMGQKEAAELLCGFVLEDLGLTN